MVKRFGLIITVLILLACRVPFRAESPVAVTVNIAVSFSGEGYSRTVVPDFTSAVDAVNVTLTSNDGFGTRTASSSASPWTVMFTGIPLGSYDVAVEVFSNGVLIGTGNVENRLLEEGGALGLTIPIAFSVQGALGDVAFTISFPVSTGIDYVRGSIEETAADQAPQLTAEAGLNRVVFTFAGLPTGTYSMVLTFRRGGETGTIAGIFREKLVMRNGFSSAWWLDANGELVSERAFVADEFLESDVSLSALAVDGVLPFADFFSAITVYDLGVIPDIASTAFTAGSSVPGQYLTYSWNGGIPVEIVPGVPSSALPTMGDNELEILVRAPDRQTVGTYRVTFTLGYSLVYDGNGNTGGSVPEDSSLYAAGATVSVADNTGGLVRDGYVFTGWNTVPDGTGISYGSGDSFSMGSGDVSLYAQWIMCGTVGVSFTTPEYPAVVFSWNEEIVTAVSVAKSGQPLLLSFTDSELSVSAWEWYLDGADSGIQTGSFGLDISMPGRYTVSCSAVSGGVRYAGSLTVTVNEPLSVNYDGNGADSGTVPSKADRLTGDTVTVSGNSGNLSRSGYAWFGWSGDPGSAVPVYFGTGSETFVMGTTSVTFFAVWNDTAPPNVTGLSAVGAAGRVTLSWTPPSAADFAGVSIKYSGDVSGTVTVLKGLNARTITGLTNGTAYTFTVRAFDSASHFSPGVTITGSPVE